MVQKFHNPFAGLDLIAPIDQRDVYDRYCQSGGRAIIDHSPFPRMVDLWFTGLSLAARRGLSPVDLSKQNTFKFNEGSVFDRDSWRVQIVMLLAISVEDNVEIAGEPRRMLTIANGLAGGGVPIVVEMLRDGDQDPIWNLSEALDRTLQQRNE